MGAPRCRMLMDVDESWALFFIFYKCIVGFAVVQVVISTFIQQTFKAASRNEEMVIKEKEAASQLMFSSLARLFDVIDESGDGIITRDEFLAVLSQSRIRAWFAAVEIDASEVEKLFEMLGKDDGNITKEAFVAAAKGLKGTARRQDIYALKLDVEHNAKILVEMRDALALDSERRQALEERLAHSRQADRNECMEDNDSLGEFEKGTKL